MEELIGTGCFDLNRTLKKCPRCKNVKHIYDFGKHQVKCRVCLLQIEKKREEMYKRVRDAQKKKLLDDDYKFDGKIRIHVGV